jgi:hypothetical protein
MFTHKVRFNPSQRSNNFFLQDLTLVVGLPVYNTVRIGHGKDLVYVKVYLIQCILGSGQGFVRAVDLLPMRSGSFWSDPDVIPVAPVSRGYPLSV